MPPQAIDLESAVLGALMLEKDAFLNCSDILCSDAFYKSEHQTIYEAIEALNEREQGVDMLTVCEELKRVGKLEEIGGAYYVTQLTSKIASAANIEFHARIILQKYVSRVAISQANQLSNAAYDNSIDANDIISEAIKLGETLNNIGDSGNKIMSYGHNINDAVIRLKEREKLAKEGKVIGIAPRLYSERKFILSYKPGQMIVIAARPSMGKTALILSKARHFASMGRPGLIFSLEMPTEELVDRNVCAQADIDPKLYEKGILASYQWEQLDHAISKMEDLPLFIDDTPNASLAHIRKTSKLYKQQHAIEWIMIDYLQLMEMTSKNKNYGMTEEVTLLSQKIKGLAKELGVPIIVLSQLNRDCEKRPDKRPELSDLRQSGAIEQDADVVMFIHRPAYYGILEDEHGNSLEGVTELIYKKNRGGETGTAYLRTNQFVSEFYDLIPQDEPFTPVNAPECNYSPSPHENDNPF